MSIKIRDLLSENESLKNRFNHWSGHNDEDIDMRIFELDNYLWENLENLDLDTYLKMQKNRYLKLILDELHNIEYTLKNE